MLEIQHHFSQHPGDKPGRYRLIDCQMPRLVGVVSNTPWPFRDRHVPTTMSDAALRVARENSNTAPEALCRRVFAGIHDVLKPLVGEPISRWRDDFDAAWDFGGDAALITEANGQLAVARVGNLRVLGLSESGHLIPILTEHTLAARDPNLTPEQREDSANVITACLANPGIPEDAIATAGLADLRWLFVGTPRLLDFVDRALAAEALDAGGTPSACERVFNAAHEAWRRAVSNPPSSALVFVRLTA